MQTLPQISDVELADSEPALSMAPDVEEQASRKKGLFSRFWGKPKQDEEPEPVADKAQSDAESVEETEETASLKDSTKSGEDAGEKAGKKRGLFGLLAAKSPTGEEGVKSSPNKKNKDAIEAQDIAFGTTLPYGKVGRICKFSKSKMGKKIAQYPERKAKYKLYDSVPGNTGLHSFYMTGFADGCARQFTASVAVFGSAGMHEQIRYGLPADVQPYSDTDKAYEKLKSKICHVSRKKPCGKKVTALEKNTVFLSIYERFGGNSRWSNLLLHSGQIVAQDNKGG